MRRAVYPDLSFSVERAAVVVVAAAAAAAGEGDLNKDAVFVEWTFRGTFEGRADVASGVTVFDFDPSSLKILRSSVYRQALPAEVDLARRTAKGEVAEGVLLDQGGEKIE